MHRAKVWMTMKTYVLYAVDVVMECGAMWMWNGMPGCLILFSDIV